MDISSITDRLLQSEEPSIRWKTLVKVPGADVASKEARALQEEVRSSVRTQRLLDGRDSSGRLLRGRSPYDKWQGAHWVLATLADIGYPAGDASLAPLRDQVLETWLSEDFYTEFEAGGKASAYKKRGVPVMEGRYRRCASQQGNALYAIQALGLDDGRVAKLVERLLHWQWPDGGWNCDKESSADTSSFMETLTPLRGLALYARRTGDDRVNRAVRSAAEIFLERRMFHRRSDGNVIHAEFTKLHYPLYWHYDILGGLKVIAEAGLIADLQCAEAKYYTVSDSIHLGADRVDWGGTSKKSMNEWVTVDALHVLKAAGAL